MKYEESLFRIKPDHHDTFSMKMTRTSRILKMRDYLINRSGSWVYSIKPESTVKIKNELGKVIQVRRELSFHETYIKKIQS